MASMGKPAATYNNRGRRKKAEELFVQVMETFERLLRPEHLNTQISIEIGGLQALGDVSRCKKRERYTRILVTVRYCASLKQRTQLGPNWSNE